VPVHHITIAAILFLAVMTPCRGTASGFICFDIETATLRERTARAKLVVYGTLANPRSAADGSGSTDFIVISVIKSHPAFDKKILRLRRYMSVADSKKPTHFLGFCDRDERDFDAYDAVAAAPATLDYMKGLLALDGNDRCRILRYCFDFLDAADRAVAADALAEFTQSTDKELGAAACKLPADKLRVWIKQSATSAVRLRLYGFLLANCGGDGDADLLLTLLEKKVGDDNPGLSDGILKGYVLLRPKKGWGYIRQLMGNSANDFGVRYHALQAARFFFDTRSDVISRAEVVDALRPTLLQSDMADLPIEYLRKWRCWDLTDRVLPLYGKFSHKSPCVDRAIIRYALQCTRPEAARFLAGLRKNDPDLVADVEELLKLEEDRL
jgi:hypothetical protein